MNLNEFPEELKREEQAVLDELIKKMDQVLDKLDDRMQAYVSEARNVDISINLDLYLAKLMAHRGMADTAENRRKILQARDELYKTRLLLQYENEQENGMDEIKVGLHSCIDGAKQFVMSWEMPLARHFVLNNTSTEFECIVKNKHGEEYHTKYKLIVKNQIDLRFTRVVKAMNLFPGIFDNETLEMMKETGFFSDAFLDEMIARFNPDEYNPDEAAKIISDEFLQELLERRTTPEFKNIVFSIQKKQGEIIQAPYSRDMVVQGCAGSGKSMIMMHRLPILLYDNPNSLRRNSLYVITPSPMYIQLAENMRHQLEITDISMGTIEQYYDYCISKYPGHKAGEYGKINHGYRISAEHEKYVYSQRCIEDICNYYDSIGNEEVPLERARVILSIKNTSRISDTYAQKISNRLLEIQNVLNVNNEIIVRYFRNIRNVLDSLYTLSSVLRHRKSDVIRELTKLISKSEEEITKAEKELEKLNSAENAVAIQNRNNIIEMAKNRIEQLQTEIAVVEADAEYFNFLNEVNKKIESVLEPFEGIKNEFSQNSIKNIYDAIDRIGQLIGGFYMLSWESSKVEDKYAAYLGTIKAEVDKVEKAVSFLQGTTDKYLDYNYYYQIQEERQILSDASNNAIKHAYDIVMGHMGIKRTESGNMRAIKCSPYIYLQVLYCYQGAPISKESLLAIDEAQGIASEEVRLLKNINGNNVILNMFGDINQHIEGTKGVDSWSEFSDISDYDYYEMQENYRNASQVTEYCNRVFGMEMNPINTPGKGVHELINDSVFEDEIINQLLDTRRAGLAAVLVSNDAEARYLLDKFSLYEQKFHNMTEEDFSIHHTRWNIICIDDAKGLEFSSVIVLSGRMSRNERYIAYTRALDDLYIYPGLVDITAFENELSKTKVESSPQGEDIDTQSRETNKSNGSESEVNEQPKHTNEKRETNHADSEVKRFFEDSGLEVIDNRDQGGRLWVIGEKKTIRNIVNSAITKFGISGKYSFGKETRFRQGWYTKTDK